MKHVIMRPENAHAAMSISRDPKGTDTVMWVRIVKCQITIAFGKALTIKLAKSTPQKHCYCSIVAMLRIDKGSRCVLRYTYILLITLMAFELL